ncbi:sirohydrochlorin cobaltochelatase [Agathobaculum sp.]|uniref:sirohydrochlorin cobaltochelatase n=1 Tax=Agathobaculum sp. TaxID=2048138 RepID=UPI002A814879|nr:sirohydrochlorin cobaltochelatase [Agathobaculum sp.]MDY3619023.1 sirohydrochlorin cobaltochelatase [Agathobaculum sp.]
MGKKALMVVSFGTSVPEARGAIEHIEKTLAAARSGYDFYRAFTSGIIRKKIALEQGEEIMEPGRLAQKLADEGYEELICQSLHVIPGHEYEKLCRALEPYRARFARLEIGKPLLWQNTDYLRLTRGLLAHMPKLEKNEAFVWMGHGTDHPADAAYALVENTFRFSGAERVYVSTVEGFPNFDYVLRRLHARQIERVWLSPLMVVAGDHARNDLAGAGEDSWKSVLESEGYDVQLLNKGLGEYDEVAALFASHLPE